MTTNADRLDQWIRGNFVDLNTKLEELYFSSENPEVVEGIGEEIKEQLVEEGKAFIVDLLKEGNTDEGFEAQFDLLGNVGLYMAACRRHEITEPSRETTSPLVEASALAMQLGASLGVAPRFASAHLETHNLAINGSYKLFTSLPDEELFVTCNTRAALAYIRAAEALLHIVPLGVSHPVTPDLLVAAKRALEDVITSNTELFQDLDIDRFFYCVRPYYKPHRVGLREYRGANAGDFAGINVIDLLGNVGLYMAACRRHEITEPSRETTSPLVEASALAMQLGASLGVAPRFASAHLETHNLAINGSYKLFTSLPDEELFVTCNTRAALA